MQLPTILAFAAVTFVAVVTPGPDVILAFANGSRFGVRRALAGMIGVLLADLALIIAVAFGLGALLAASEFWFEVLKFVGAGYLVYLGIRMMLSRGVLLSAQHAQPDNYDGPASIGLRSVAVTLTNPKAYLFFSALLPQFVNPAEEQWPQFAILALVFSVVEFAIMLGYSIVGAKAVHLVTTKGGKWLERLCGGALVASGLSLAFVKRASAQH